MKRTIKKIIAILPAVILQVLWLLLIFFGFKYIDDTFSVRLLELIHLLLSILAFLFVLYNTSKNEEPTYKLLWVTVILMFPIFGAVLFLCFGDRKSVRELQDSIDATRAQINPTFETDTKVVEQVSKENNCMAKILPSFINNGFPLLKNGKTKYYSLGEYMWKDMLCDLKKAKKYIYIEYFIIDNGKFWGSIVDILKEKVKENVEVKVIFDDIGSMGTYGKEDINNLASFGIQCFAFNPLSMISTKLNNRDHRKIMVIDGQVAYSGGVNIADEYVNEVVKYGHWKDIGFRLEGGGVAGYNYMFVEFWNAFCPEKLDKIDINVLKDRSVCNEEDGYIITYYDSPQHEFHLSNELFCSILENANKYVWFYSPYLIIGDLLRNAIRRARARGVEINLIVPGVPDKKIINRLTKSYYYYLIEYGVNIYEYTPGFVHAKAVLTDDEVCAIGTVNLDYRSLFLHYECEAIFYKSKVYEDLKADYLDTLKKSKKIGMEDINTNFFSLLFDAFLRVIAPLM